MAKHCSSRNIVSVSRHDGDVADVVAVDGGHILLLMTKVVAHGHHRNKARITMARKGNSSSSQHRKNAGGRLAS